MKSNPSCITATVADALVRLPGPKGERFASVFGHGSGEYVCGDNRQRFDPTDILFAAAGVEHRFEDFSDDLTLWVLFYGPEGGESNGK